MDKIILGILLLKRLTVYEIRNILRQNFKDMCSDSMGSIQAAIKKLFANGMVTCNELVEKGVNKKIYSITPAGRYFFLEWLRTPMDMSKAKNMELGKLLFMGLVPEGDRIRLMDEIVAGLQEDLAYLQKIMQAVEDTDSMQTRYLDYLKKDPEYMAGILEATGNASPQASIIDLNRYELLTLKLGLDTTRFYLDWFTTVRNSLKNSMEGDQNA